MSVDWNAIGEERMALMAFRVRQAREVGAKALARQRAGNEQEARGLYGVALAPLGLLVKKLDFGLEHERTLVLSQPRRRHLPRGMRSFTRIGVTDYETGASSLVFRLRLPVVLAPVATDFESAIGLAALEELANAKSYGQCPYCKQWWLSDEMRDRRTCGTEACDKARKRDWRQKNPEAREHVAKRVAKWRRENLRAKGVRGGKART